MMDFLIGLSCLGMVAVAAWAVYRFTSRRQPELTDLQQKIERLTDELRELSAQVDRLEAQHQSGSTRTDSQPPTGVDALSSPSPIPSSPESPPETIAQPPSPTTPPAPESTTGATIHASQADAYQIAEITKPTAVVEAAPHLETDSPQIPPEPKRTPSSPLLSWFRRSHIMVQIGLLILFLRIAFLLKYAADQGWLSIELRHVDAAVGGLLLGS